MNRDKRDLLDDREFLAFKGFKKSLFIPVYPR